MLMKDSGGETYELGEMLTALANTASDYSDALDEIRKALAEFPGEPDEEVIFLVPGVDRMLLRINDLLRQVGK